MHHDSGLEIEDDPYITAISRTLSALRLTKLMVTRSQSFMIVIYKSGRFRPVFQNDCLVTMLALCEVTAKPVFRYKWIIFNHSEQIWCHLYP